MRAGRQAKLFEEGNAWLDREFPLYRYVPKYVAHLKPGDVLFNPRWWWHAVDNLTPSSNGVTTRWTTPLVASGSPFEWLSWCSWQMLKIRLHVSRGRRMTDEESLQLLYQDPRRG